MVRARVTAARDRQLARLRGTGAYANAHMTVRHLRRLCRLEPDAVRLLDRAYEAKIIPHPIRAEFVDC